MLFWENETFGSVYIFRSFSGAFFRGEINKKERFNGLFSKKEILGLSEAEVCGNVLAPFVGKFLETKHTLCWKSHTGGEFIQARFEGR